MFPVRELYSKSVFKLTNLILNVIQNAVGDNVAIIYDGNWVNHGLFNPLSANPTKWSNTLK